MPLSGQDAPAKKLLFQEIIDKDGTIPFGVNSMIGSRLVTAIMDITDYMVLQDRVAFDGNSARGETAAVADDILVVEVLRWMILSVIVSRLCQNYYADNPI